MTRLRPRTWVTVSLMAIAAGAAGLAITSNTFVEAADHLDPPSRTNPMADPPGTDRNADIADVFAWHQGTGADRSVVTILSFSGPNMPVAGQEVPCDRDVLYGIHISNDADLDADFDIWGRFGEDDLGNCFIQLTGVPGAGAAPLVIPVEQQYVRDDVSAYVGLRDDAFFFDLVGFRETLMTGNLAMTDDRDFFAGQNTPAIVVEFPLNTVSPSDQPFRVWATTSRTGT